MLLGTLSLIVVQKKKEIVSDVHILFSSKLKQNKLKIFVYRQKNK